MNHEECILLVIDVQDAFRKIMPEYSNLFSKINKLVEGCKMLGIPIIKTEQYPQGLGRTVNEISLPEHDHIEKTEFSCFSNAGFMETLSEKHTHKKVLIISGIMTHVCVYQTVKEALKQEYDVYVVADAVAAQHREDHDIGLRRMEQLGAKLSTVEMMLFEILRGRDNPLFKQVANVIKRR